LQPLHADGIVGAPGSVDLPAAIVETITAAAGCAADAAVVRTDEMRGALLDILA
jgi:hypothetical protein